MSLTGFIDRVTGKSTVSTKPAAEVAREAHAAPFIPAKGVEVGKEPVAEGTQLYTVTVAPGKTIGRGKTAKTAGETLDVTHAEAVRLRALGFIA